VGLLERIGDARAAGRGDESRYSIDTWISQYLIPSAGQFTYGNTTYPYGQGLPQTLAGNRVAEIANSIPGYRMALQQCPPAFAAQMVRSLVLSQARFTFRNRMSAATPRRTFGNRDLALLETPWVNATTGDLLARMEWHAGLAGNASTGSRDAAVLRLTGGDPVRVVDGAGLGVGCRTRSSPYRNGRGPASPAPLDVAHWAPPGSGDDRLGMSWLMP
jgi:hypothetical protein